MIETESLEEIIADLFDLMMQSQGPFFIGIDGINGAGKTTLADELCLHFAAVRISIDDYLEKGKGQFLSIS